MSKVGPPQDKNVTILQHIKALVREMDRRYRSILAEMDLRYQQRYDAQIKAVEAAFLANQTAMQAALLAAEKAVQTAMTASEKAVCVSADTPVLCADLVWRPAGDLLVGDELLAFDEEPAARKPNMVASRGRMHRRAIVTSNSLERAPLLRVNTEFGSVRCTYDHPWLVKRPHGAWRWVEAQDLRPGDAVMHAYDVWDTDRSWESGWLAGMFDGEGCLGFNGDRNGRARLSIVQIEGATCDRIGEAIKARVCNYLVLNKPPRFRFSSKEKPTVEWQINIRNEILKLLGSVRPLRLLVRSSRIWEGRPIGGWHRDTAVISVEGAGTGVIAALGTSTQTYIAGGFCMHNTKAEVAAEKRFDAVNEFRGAYQDIIAQQMPRVEAEQRLVAMSEKIDDLKAILQERQGRSGGLAAGWTYLVGAFGIIAVIVAIIIKLH